MKYITTEPGEPFVMKDSLTQQRQSFATYSDSVMSDRLHVTTTESAVVQFGWTAFGAMELKQTLEIADTEAGANTTVYTVKT